MVLQQAEKCTKTSKGLRYGGCEHPFGWKACEDGDDNHAMRMTQKKKKKKKWTCEMLDRMMNMINSAGHPRTWFSYPAFSQTLPILRPSSGHKLYLNLVDVIGKAPGH